MAKEMITKVVKHQELYGFTVKYVRTKNPKHEDYMSFLKLLSSKGEILDFHYEDKKKDLKTPCALHIHGVVSFRRNPYFKNLHPRYYNVFYEPLYDSEGWKRYSTKNVNQNPQKESDITNPL